MQVSFQNKLLLLKGQKNVPPSLLRKNNIRFSPFIQPTKLYAFPSVYYRFHHKWGWWHPHKSLSIRLLTDKILVYYQVPFAWQMGCGCGRRTYDETSSTGQGDLGLCLWWNESNQNKKRTHRILHSVFGKSMIYIVIKLLGSTVLSKL